MNPPPLTWTKATFQVPSRPPGDSKLVPFPVADIVSGSFGISRGDTNGSDRGVSQPRFSLVLLACGRFLSTSACRIDCQVLAKELAPLSRLDRHGPPHRHRAGDRDGPVAPPVLSAQIRAVNPWGAGRTPAPNSFSGAYRPRQSCERARISPRMTKSFDVFLSHNSKDKPAVRELAEALRARGLKGWLDEWELVPGRPWQEALEEIVETTRASAVLVGKDGLGPWHDAEMRGCLSEFVHHKLPVIPVSRACFGRAEEGQTAPVGFFPAGRGPFGTLDQAGNVWEWCQDVLDKTAYVKRGREPLDPIERGEAGKQRKRAIRGGSWLFSEEGLRAAFRHGFPPKTKVNWIGFRVATPSLHPSTPVSR